MVLIIYFAKQFNGTLRTDRVPPDALHRPQVVARCDIFFNSNLNIINTSIPHSMPRIKTVDECDNLQKAPKTSQILLFYTPVLSDRYDVWEGTHATNPLKIKDNLHHIHFLPHRDACEYLFAPQVKKPSSLPTVRNQTDTLCGARVKGWRPSPLIRE